MGVGGYFGCCCVTVDDIDRRVARLSLFIHCDHSTTPHRITPYRTSPTRNRVVLAADVKKYDDLFKGKRVVMFGVPGGAWRGWIWRMV